jgi:hypothetical protein
MQQKMQKDEYQTIFHPDSVISDSVCFWKLSRVNLFHTVYFPTPLVELILVYSIPELVLIQSPSAYFGFLCPVTVLVPLRIWYLLRNSCILFLQNSEIWNNNSNPQWDEIICHCGTHKKPGFISSWILKACVRDLLEPEEIDNLPEFAKFWEPFPFDIKKYIDHGKQQCKFYLDGFDELESYCLEYKP